MSSPQITGDNGANAKRCDLKLAPFSRIVGQKDNIVFLDEVIPLPREIKNGSIEIPAPIIMSASTEDLMKLN